jgi:vitamin B12/bleomycin/antimicrobial peptide transport system ATP-binding/permease protein
MRLREKLLAFKTFTGKVVRLSAPYFRSDEKWKARGLLAAIVTLNLLGVYLLVLYNDWYRVFYNALEKRDQPVFWEQLFRFTWIAFAMIILAVYKFYLTQLLEVRWRAWMTENYLQRWLDQQVFYKMELARFSGTAQATPDNPDQRIQEDLNLFTTYTISLSMGLLNAVVTLVSFVGILWGLSGGFTFSAGGSSYEIPGFMVWMAVLYCVAGSVITHFIGRPQIRLNFMQQRYEADFRHRLVRVREYSESIALDKGAKVERGQLSLRFSDVLSNYLTLLKAQKNLTWFTSFFGQAAVVFPFIVAAPRFFSGAIQLGELMQIGTAFGRVQDSLSWFVDNYSNLASWRATTDRLTSFEDAIAAQSREAGARHATTGAQGIETRDLELALPTGDVLLSGLSLRTEPGDRVLVQGPSGSGKSTLFRAFSGIWPFAKGTVAQPAEFEKDAMFIPQRPYFPQGKLRDALAYPEPATQYTDAALKEALKDALLPKLAQRLDDEDAWSQKLSGGEQQRLAIARVLLKKPRWIFADEATSALDESAEKTVYDRLMALAQQRDGALVSIAHRSGLASFHNRTWMLKPAPEGEKARFHLQQSGV